MGVLNCPLTLSHLISGSSATMVIIMNDTRPYRLEPVSMGDVAGSHDLTKSLELAEHLEDEEIARKLEMENDPGRRKNSD